MRFKIMAVAAALAFALFLAGCAQQNPPAGNGENNQPPAEGSASVEISNFAFAPASLTIAKGTTVTWTNRDSAQHTATGDNGEFDTGLILQSQSANVTFNNAGTFNYHCTPHPFMKGTIIVE